MSLSELENYQHYKNAIEKWLKLRDGLKSRPVTEKDIETCLAIHWDLLQCAEEVSYPTAYHLLRMLQTSVNLLDQPWQQIWQDYLSAQLVDGQYIDYQECALLWAVLFPELQEQQKLADLLTQHYYSQIPILKRLAHRFIANLYLDLRDLRYLRYSRYLRYLRDLRDLRDLQRFTIFAIFARFARFTRFTDLYENYDIYEICDICRICEICEINFWQKILQKKL